MFSIQDKSIKKIFSNIINYAIDGRASNIHIELVGDNIRVRYRMGGLLSSAFVLPGHFYRSLVSHIKHNSGIYTKKTIGIKRGIIKTTIDNIDIDLNVSVIPLLDNNEKIVIGVNHNYYNANSFEFSPQDRSNIISTIGKNGIILMTGADNDNIFGYFYSFLNTLRGVGCDVVSVEDRVDIDIGGVNQIEISESIGLNFASALNISLNDNPDIVCVDSVLGGPELDILIKRSFNKLILLTICSRDLEDVILRVRNMGVDPKLLILSLKLLINCDNKSNLVVGFK